MDGTIFDDDKPRDRTSGEGWELDGLGGIWNILVLIPQLASQSGRIVSGLVVNLRKVDMGTFFLLEI